MSRLPATQQQLAALHALHAHGFAWRSLERVGDGATAVVFRVKHVETGQVAALKVGKARGEAAVALIREAELIARVDRRWGPRFLDAGTLPEGVAGMSAGARFVATEWTPGVPLDLRNLDTGTDRERLAAVVAHGVASGLAELHEAGVRHGDVKPANIVLAPSSRRLVRDAAANRGATLIDLGLAGNAGIDDIAGATPRYVAPEMNGFAGVFPAADLFALGLVLAEVLDPAVAASSDPRGRGRAGDGEPWRWVDALLAESPGGRPSASWLAARAAKWLGLRADPADAEAARVAQVKRAYLATRARELRGGRACSQALTGMPRAWLAEALSFAARLDAHAVSEGEAAPELAPLTAIGRARWMVSLVGPAAAAWSLGEATRIDGVSDEELAERLVTLARERPASSWTLEDVLGAARGSTTELASGTGLHEASPAWEMGAQVEGGSERVARLMRELARPAPEPAAVASAEDMVAAENAPTTLAIQLASTLLRAGESGRAWASLALVRGAEADALRAEVARRRGDRAVAKTMAERAADAGDDRVRWGARATLARLAWDAGDLSAADEALADARGAAAAEVRALIAYRRGTYEEGLRIVDDALVGAPDAEACARLEATRGLLEHARGASRASMKAFARAVELATRSAAIVEEATYLTGEAAAATAVGEIGRALASATRAALLWERLGRHADAARAWLSRAGALSTIGASHAADEAAEEAEARALASGDRRAAAFAKWASVEARPAGDERARREAIAADRLLVPIDDANPRGPLGTLTPEDGARAAARLLVWAPDAIADARIEAVDAICATLGVPARLEWWGARATAALLGRRTDRDHLIVGALAALVDAGAPLSSRGPALDAASRLARQLGDGEVAQRFDVARRAAARALHDGTPPALRASLAQTPWARSALAEDTSGEAAFAPAQVAQLESIVRALGTRDRLRPLLEQVLDTMVLWTGVERGLLLLHAPDGRLVPRAARNLARRDLKGEQLALSLSIARRAIETGDAVVATDAFSTLGDMHASVHALRLRSVLAVPLIARGESLGVVYLDDRARKGAFGPRELAWVRVVASQAAMAIADARDQVLLKRAVRRSERAQRRMEELLVEREVALDKAQTELELSRASRDGEGGGDAVDGRGTRFPYDAIVGRSEPMRATLKLVDRVTASDIPVLIVGESGTGKELIARAMHANGPRAKRAFVSENCASVPETLLESTLFGHVKGAFTGASSTRAGLFDVADSGTLFLDEIGEMPLTMQSKLLRVLQDGEVRAVGGERTRKVDVRIIGATHRDLEAMVARGAFREDLFYRLNVITIRVPSLRERGPDMPILVAHMLEKHAAGRDVRVTRAAMEKLTSYPWPGNVRQLENEIRRAIVLADDRIDVAELSSEVVRGGPSAARGTGLGLRSRVDALEAELVREALEKTKHNQTRAAQLLGLSRFGLQKMMKRLNIVAARPPT